ncbi:MAG: recombinase family protein [Nanoarchaeota archaeon]
MERTKCIKCSYESEDNFLKFEIPLCSICYRFSPNTENKFKEYVSEKINSNALDSFRKYSEIGRPQLKGMTLRASQGSQMSRPPFGYKFSEGKLVPAENFREVEELFEEFLTTNISLRQLSQKHNLSVNGLKKILSNFAYIGKVKFNNQIHQGNHQAIISTTLFNHVQNKLDRLRKVNIQQE